jgi:prolipoprotein diacylglyceryl transferase
MLDLFIQWNVSPEAFSIGDVFTVRWYGILYGCAFLFSSWAFRELVKSEMSSDTVNELLVYMILGTIIGARVGDCFFYHPLHFLQHPWEIVAIWRGGLSSHGGACGILVALYLFSRKIRKPYIWVLDRVVIVIGVAGFFIRMGNLMNHEIYGHSTTFPWGFCFIENISQWLQGASPKYSAPSHPTQIYEALYYAFTWLALRGVYRWYGNRPKPFFIFGLFLIIVFVFRFCIEFIKNPQEEFEKNMMFDMGQWLSVPFILAGIASLIVSRRQPRPTEKPQPAPLKNVSAVRPYATPPAAQNNVTQPRKKKKRP